MGGKHGTEALGKGHPKGHGGGGSVVLELRPEVAKELHQILTAALAGHGGKHPGKLAKPGADAVGSKGLPKGHG